MKRVKEQRQNKKEHKERSSIFQSAVIPGLHITVERFNFSHHVLKGAGIIFFWLTDKRHVQQTCCLLHVEVVQGFINQASRT